MRLIILNPQANQCGKMIYNWLFRSPQHLKYAYLWEEALKTNREVAFLVDGKQSSFYQTAYFQKTIARVPFILKVFSAVEYWMWRRLNKLSSRDCKTYTDSSQLNPQEDVIFTFGFTCFKSDLQDYSGIVLVHFSHYHLNTEEIATYMRQLKHCYVVSEGDLSNNDYLKHYFPELINRTYQLPFTYYPGRFNNTKPFNERVNKCFASGPMSVPASTSFVKYYGRGVSLNPMREMIYQHRKEIEDTVAAYIFPHDYAIKGMREIKTGDSLATQLAKKYLPAWVLTSVLHYKLPYYDFDIVKKYNEHTMFSSPEERTGLPSLKMLEGILCGSVFVGIDHSMYTNIGFRDGVNYIAYNDGDLDDMTRKIHYYQGRLAELEDISKNALQLIIGHFTPDKIFEVFWHDLDSFLMSRKTKLSCSFVVSDNNKF